MLSGRADWWAVTNFLGQVLSAQLPLLKGWGYPIFGPNFNLWNPALKRVSLQVPSSGGGGSFCKIPLFINYNLLAYWKFLYQFISSVEWSIFIRSPVWFSKMRFEKQFILVCLGGDWGLSTCWSSLVSQEKQFYIAYFWSKWLRCSYFINWATCRMRNSCLRQHEGLSFLDIFLL